MLDISVAATLFLYDTFYNQVVYPFNSATRKILLMSPTNNSAYISSTLITIN